MKTISAARCFRTFSQCGSDSWMSSSKTPPSPFRSCCLSNFRRLFPSRILNIGLNWKRPSLCSSFGLFGSASVDSHWKWKFEDFLLNSKFSTHGFSWWTNVQLICFIQDLFDRQWMIFAAQVSLFHVIDYFCENRKSLLWTSCHCLVAHRLLGSCWFRWLPWC